MRPWLRSSGHGTVAPKSFTMSMDQRSFPVSVSAQSTWHFGPMAMTLVDATAGTVRVTPWSRLRECG
jgi:hypothetical protein